MTINFELPIYETLWTDTVDRILGYNPDERQYIVQDVITGEIRTHRTKLSLRDMSLDPTKYSKLGQQEIKEYFDRLDLNRIYC
jgi:hypothetical protein